MSRENICLKIAIAGILSAIVFLSCQQDQEKKVEVSETKMSAENIRLRYFKMTLDRLLVKEIPESFLFYAQNCKGPATLDTLKNEDEKKATGFVGTFDYDPLPASGEIYNCNLTGDNKNEYLITIELSPLINGGGFYMLVFADDENENRFLSMNNFTASFIDSLKFLEMNETSSQKDILVYSDQERSVYWNTGFKQLRLIDDTLEFVFSTFTFEVDYLKLSLESMNQMPPGQAIQYYKTLTFEDLDNDSLKEIIVIRKDVKLVADPNSKDSMDVDGIMKPIYIENYLMSEKIFCWNEKEKKYLPTHLKREN